MLRTEVRTTNLTYWGQSIGHDIISFPVARSGDLTAENTEDTESENRDLNNSDATGHDMNRSYYF